MKADGGSFDFEEWANRELGDNVETTTETAQAAQKKPDQSAAQPMEQEELFAFGQTFADGPVVTEGDAYYRKESRIIAQLQGRLSHGQRESELDEIGRDRDAEKKSSDDTFRSPLSEQVIVGGKAKVAGTYEATEGSESLGLEDLAAMSNERQAPENLPTSRLRGDGRERSGPCWQQCGRRTRGWRAARRRTGQPVRREEPCSQA